MVSVVSLCVYGECVGERGSEHAVNECEMCVWQVNVLRVNMWLGEHAQSIW